MHLDLLSIPQCGGKNVKTFRLFQLEKRISVDGELESFFRWLFVLCFDETVSGVL